MRDLECTDLHHVNVVVGSLDEARAFYCDLLGLQEIERPTFPTEGFWLQVGAAQIHIALGDEPSPRRHHFALVVTDFEGAIQHLEGVGLKVTRFPTVIGAVAQAAIRDPAGNLVELREGER